MHMHKTLLYFLYSLFSFYFFYLFIDLYTKKWISELKTFSYSFL